MKAFFTENCSFRRHDWCQVLADKIGECMTDKKTQMHPMVFVDPMSRINSFLIHSVDFADTVVQLFETDDGDFVIFQPAIPQEVTSYVTEPPIKTRPLNSDSDMNILAESISIFARKDFIQWQSRALLESQSAAEWRCQSTAFVASLAKEAWCPNVSVADDGSIKAAVGSVVAKLAPGKLTLTFSGKGADYLDVIRGALRDEHRRREARRAEEDSADSGNPDQEDLPLED